MNNAINQLELLLEHAARSPAERPAFYRALLESEILVLGNTSSGKEGSRVVSEGEKISIVHWMKNDDTPIIPFFTSIEALQRVLTEESSYVGLPARSFFEMTLGSQLVLNPRSPYGKEFVPDEIKALLETGMNHVAEPQVVEKETRVLLGQPANYPVDMISALTELLAKHSSVIAAYLCQMVEQTSAGKPALVIGFAGDNDMTDAMKEAGSVVAETVPAGVPVNFVVVREGEGGIGSYMLSSVSPFYERSWGSKVRSMMDPQRT